MTFARLRTMDWVAMLAALALLLVMAADWYSTTLGDEARQVQQNTQGHFGGEAGQDLRDANQDAKNIAEGQERNAWQTTGLIDRVILLSLLATVALALGAGFLRAAGRSFEPPLTPSALAAVAAALSALLVTYRIIQEPGLDDATNVKAGAPLAVALLGLIAFACARGLKHEEEGRPFRERRAENPAEPVAE
ncbi:MAG TPA: hypothetical protein VGF21_03920 [Thermoleophilaceae bacterium]